MTYRVYESALKEYQELLKSDQAVSSQVFQVEFVKAVNGEMCALQLSDADEVELTSLKVWDESTLHNETIELNRNASEVILFSHALQFNELVQEVVDTAKEIVAYSRRHNDTWEMWMDDMEVFGIEALLLLAKKMPEYAYFLGAYFVPYWDTEHADYALSYPYELVSKYGLDDNMLKMFCYCDNGEARAMMLGSDYYYESCEIDMAEYFEKKSKQI